MSDGIRRIVCSNKNGEADGFLQAINHCGNNRPHLLHENLRAYFLLKKVGFDSSKKLWNCVNQSHYSPASTKYTHEN
jgi:hypothetical protein